MEEIPRLDMSESVGVHDALPAAGVEALHAELGGRWRVQTVGSTHFFDLDNAIYVRHRGTSRRGFDQDGRQMKLTRVERWPRVGGSFFIWLDDPDMPDLVEHWRQSSMIVSITPLEPVELR